ncbi:hypothetical protein D9756_006922 [Leucocoprinus leucothites]|uniref:Uncharacterized protein n=1 Tax=Leucocoprinus leucothites TaxID=201217 RepID=A0A8H5D6Q1_9AGAR|nr:hypothetical protein D9756_006922 [Leucoagaricus leucothites]
MRRKDPPTNNRTPSSSSSMLEGRGHECLKSADEVAKMMQKDDIVILLWSWIVLDRQKLFNLLAGTQRDLDTWKFVAKEVKHPVSGARILLVSTTDAYSYFMLERKQGLERILSRMNKVGVKLGAHTWVHHITDTWPIKHGMPVGWDELKESLNRDVAMKMSNVTFLSICWEEAGLEEGQERELNIRTMLREDADRGLAFGQLPVMDRNEAWCIIDGIIELTTTLLDQRAGKEERSGRLSKLADDIRERKIKKDEEAREKAEEARKKAEEARKKAEEVVKKAEEDSRVRLLQHELRMLYAELDKTEHGKGVKAKFQRASDDQKRIMERLIGQLCGEWLEPEEKERLEKVIEEEYILCLRDFRGHFAEVRAMGIEVGFNLREFYGLLEPEKKWLGIF